MIPLPPGFRVTHEDIRGTGPGSPCTYGLVNVEGPGLRVSIFAIRSPAGETVLFDIPSGCPSLLTALRYMSIVASKS
jgi:hypothetical protein